MKRILSLLLISTLFITACKKSSPNDVTPNVISSQIVGTWLQVKNITTYTDLSGNIQVVNNNVTNGTLNGYINYIINADGTARKTYTDSRTGFVGQTYITAVPYSIISSNGKNYIDFAVSPGDISDTYQIVSVTDHSLVLNINYGKQPGNVVPGTNAIGTNGVLDEEYTK
jgi:hypothetical protein